jgi:hypothetical protein
MIHIPNTGYEPGTIIVAAAIQPRYYEFTMSTEGLHVPAGTKMILERSCDVTQNFNKGMQRLTGSWAWFVGDDHAFAPDTLLKLLAHRVNVVVPISPCKVPPWMPCVMHGPVDPDLVWHENMLLYDWNELSGKGLLPLPKGDFIGQSGMLVQKPIMDKIGYPWFKCGQLDPGRLQEDMFFCKELQDLGETVYVDQDMIFDHYFIVGVTTRRHEGKHVPALKFGDMVVVLPEAKPAFDPNTLPTGEERPALKWSPLPRTLAAVSPTMNGEPIE